MVGKIPLEALRTFEVAARHGSLAAAAKELHLTDSAVSHQLRKLRLSLGFDLFVRQGRALRLSREGASLLKTLRPALQDIDEAATRLRRSDGTSGPITIACSSMFASRVLSQHIGAFAEKFPQIRCYVRAMENGEVLAAEEMDVGIVFGEGGWSGMWEARIAAVRYSPVCSPRLFKSAAGMPKEPAGLLDHVILHIDDGADWRRWLDAAGAAGRPIPRELFTNDVGVALEIACRSGGVTLASDLMAAPDLLSGTLIRPFPQAIEVKGGWHLVCPQKSVQIPRVRTFLAWLAQALDFPRPAFA